MKKIYLLAMIVFLFNACTQNTTELVAPNVYSVAFTVGDNNWKKGLDDETGTYYYCTFTEPKLTQEVFNYGVMQAFIYGKNRDSLSPLPFSDFLIDENNYKWEEHFTVEFEVGLITFILKVSDHVPMFEGKDPILPFYTVYDFLVRFLW